MIDRLKTIAKQKVAEGQAKIQKEKEYQRFKHPTIGYLKTGKTTTNYSQSKEFGERLAKEQATAAQKKLSEQNEKPG